MDRKKIFYTLLSPLVFQLQLSEIAYRKYLQNRIFLHAEALKRSNKLVLRLVSNHAALIPAEIRKDFLSLLDHYNTWFAQFSLHKKKLSPEPGDEFVFLPVDEQSRFPKEAEHNIFQFHEKLKQEMENNMLVETKSN
jgi:hypothetical protein